MNIEKWIKYVSIPALMLFLLYEMVLKTIEQFGPKVIFLDIVSIVTLIPVLIFLYTVKTEDLIKELEEFLKK